MNSLQQKSDHYDEQFDAMLRVAMLDQEDNIPVDESGDWDDSRINRLQNTIIARYAQEKKIRNTEQIKTEGVKLFRKAGMVLASITMTAVLCLAIALAVSPDVRNAVGKLLMQQSPGAEVYTLSADGEAVRLAKVPDSWQGDYYLSYLPEKYVLHFADDNSAEYCHLENDSASSDGTEAGAIWVRPSVLLVKGSTSYLTYMPKETELYFTPRQAVIYYDYRPENGSELPGGTEVDTMRIQPFVQFKEISDQSCYEMPKGKCYLQSFTYEGRSWLQIIYPEYDQAATILWNADGRLFEVTTVGTGIEETKKIAAGVYRIREKE